MEQTWPCATNTGILCRFTPCLDIDVLDAEAAGAVEDLVRERFEDAGYVLTRIGKAPKRAVPFRTQEPFAKIAVPLIAPMATLRKSWNSFVTGNKSLSLAPIRTRASPIFGSAKACSMSRMMNCLTFVRRKRNN